MGYTIGSAKDAVQTPGQTEQDYMNLFNKNDAAIWQYHKQTGAPLEDSFQAVTGRPWPAGRSIKWVGGTKGNSGNGFEFTKDRTVKSVLGKYIAGPAAYGTAIALTGGAASPLLFGLGGGAAAGTGSGAGLLSGAAIPSTVGATSLAAVAPTVAGTTAATTAGGVGSWLTKNAASSLIPVAGNLVGGVLQNNANKDAAKIQAASLKEALDFEKQRYADITGRLKPFLDAGETATQRMERLMGGTVPPRPPVHTPPPPTEAPVPVASAQTPPVAAAAPASGTPPTVGMTKTFPNGKVGTWDGTGWRAQ